MNNIIYLLGLGVLGLLFTAKKARGKPIIQKPIPVPDDIKDELDTTDKAPSSNPSDITYNKTFIETFIETAEKYLDIPYILGGNYTYNGSQGVDCSGLIMIALWDLGIDCPDLQAYYQSTGSYWFGTNTFVIPKSELKRGDLIYYDWQIDNPASDTDQLVVDHCGVYVGGSKVLEASGSKVQYKDYDGYRQAHTHTVRRFKNDGSGLFKNAYKDIKGYF